MFQTPAIEEYTLEELVVTHAHASSESQQHPRNLQLETGQASASLLLEDARFTVYEDEERMILTSVSTCGLQRHQMKVQ